jgi:DNA polymerase-4
MSRKIIHLDLDAFFCAVEELLDPSLHDKAFAVGGHPETRGVVSSCSYPARHFGVHSAMPMAQAIRACPGLIVIYPRHGAYGEMSRRVMNYIEQLTPLVEQISIDEAFMDVSDLPEPGLVIAERLQSTINRELKLPCSLGVATNKLVAKIACDAGKVSRKGTSPPNAITVVPPGEEAAFLAPLPVRALWGIGPKTDARLSELGIHTIGDLANQADAFLLEEFGNYGPDLARRAKGIDESPVGSGHSIKSISQETTFDRDINDEVTLQRTLKDLSETVGRRLRRDHLSATTIRLKLRWSSFQTITRQKTLPQPTDQDSVIFESVLSLFNQVWPGERPVRLLGVGSSGLNSTARQLSLWDSGLEKEHRLLAAVDTLRERFGSRVIQRGSHLTTKHKDPGIQPENKLATSQNRPLANSYWVVPGRFLAGEYPGALDEAEAQSKIKRLLDAGISCFIDLTEPGESGLIPYDHLLNRDQVDFDKDIQYIRLSIQDCGIPERPFMEKILKTISDGLANGENIYLHCWGGRGRTGTVVGCYLVQQGVPAEEALEQIRRWRQPTPRAYFPSPETNSQLMMVMTWTP